MSHLEQAQLRVLACLPLTDDEWEAGAFTARLNAIYDEQTITYVPGTPADVSSLVAPPVLVAALAVQLTAVETGRTPAVVVAMLRQIIEDLASSNP